MDTKTTSWVSYLTWIGWLIAYCTGDKEGAKFHLNQSLVLNIFSTGFAFCSFIFFLIPIVGWIAYIACQVFFFVCFILGIIAAANQEEKELPLIGKIKILK